MTKALLTVVALTVLFCMPARATDGNKLVGIGAVQNSTAGAGIASPQDATWALLNPASLVDLDRRLDIGVDMLFPRREVEVDGPRLVFNIEIPEERRVLSLANHDGGIMRDRSPVFSPNLGIVLPFERLTLGIGIFGVQGNAVDYPESRTIPGLRDGNGDRRAELQVFKMPISLAYRFENGWSIGASLIGVHSRLRTDSLTLELTPTKGAYRWDDSWGAGIALSAYRRWDQWSFGATLTSRQYMTRFSRYKDLMRYRLDFPWQFQAGIAYRPADKWEFLFDYKFIRWSSVSQIARKTVQGGLSWRDQHIFKTGLAYDISRRWTLRTGFSYGRTPVPSEAIFSNVLFPAITETHASAGASFRITPRQEFHLAYVHAFRKTKTERGTGDLFSRGGAGTRMSIDQHGVTLQYSLKF